MSDKTADESFWDIFLAESGHPLLDLDQGIMVDAKCTWCGCLCEVPLGIFAAESVSEFVCINCDEDALLRPEMEISVKGYGELRRNQEDVDFYVCEFSSQGGREQL